jgi:HTH-type transcriptional regulator, sugar sensing transcriptional regulator
LDQIVEELQRLGFSQYEARAYVSLLTHAPVTGYELSKRSGVPRSMVYETLGKLIDHGAAHIVPTEPVMYAPVPAAVLVDRFRQSTSDTLGYLERELGALERSPEIDVISHVRGESQIDAEVVSIIDQAKSELWLGVWGPQVDLLRSPVERALARDVTVFSVLFGDDTSELGWTFRHSYMAPDVVQKRLGGHLTIAARDGEEVVIAEYIESGSSWAVKTRDPALVLIATDYVRHDIMFDVIVPDFGVDKLTSIWKRDPRLVHVLTGQPAPARKNDADRPTRQKTARREVPAKAPTR